MDSGLIASIVTVLGFVFGYYGITIDPAILTSLVGGIVTIVTAVAAIWSTISHYQKNQSATAPAQQ